MDETKDGVYAQSAAIPYMLEDRTPLVLLITSRRGKHWIVPKGIIETWQTPPEAAMEEAYEEAGVRGKLVGGAVGEYEYEKWGGTCRVKVFLMRVKEVFDDWPEADFRDREWVNIKEALKLVDNPDLRKLIKSSATLMK